MTYRVTITEGDRTVFVGSITATDRLRITHDLNAPSTAELTATSDTVALTRPSTLPSCGHLDCAIP